MNGYVQNIESIAVKNGDFRQVLYTAKNCQLVVMALKPKEEIGMEVHKLDQFFRVEEGTGEAVLDGVRTAISAGFAVLIPAGTNHNIINTGNVPMKLYTLYAPPNHRDGVVHHTRGRSRKGHRTLRRQNNGIDHTPNTVHQKARVPPLRRPFCGEEPSVCADDSAASCCYAMNKEGRAIFQVSMNS